MISESRGAGKHLVFGPDPAIYSPSGFRRPCLNI